MLVLTRKKGETLVIDAGGGVEVTVIEVGNGSVRLGIEAPRSVEVWRKEILLQVKDSNVAAASEGERDTRTLENILKKRK